MRRIYLAIPVMIAGCANVGSIHKEFQASEPKVISIDMQQRVVVVKPSVDAQGRVVVASAGAPVMSVCTEPSPDAVSSWGASIKGGLKAGSVTVSDLAAALNETGTYVGARTETIQLLRDGMFRSCEGYINGMLTPDQFNVSQKHYQNVMLGLVAMEQLRLILQPPPAPPYKEAGNATKAQAAAKTSNGTDNPDGRTGAPAKNAQSPQADPHATALAATAQSDGASDPTAIQRGKARTSRAAKAVSSPQSKTPPAAETPNTQQSAAVQAVSDGIVQIVNHIILDNLYIDTCDQTSASLHNPQESQSAFTDSGSSWRQDRERLCVDLLHTLLTGPTSSKTGHYDEVKTSSAQSGPEASR